MNNRHQRRLERRQRKKARAAEADSPLHAASSLFQSGQVEQAGNILVKFLNDQPDNFDALNLLGIIRATTGNPDAAFSLFEKAATVRPGDPGVHVNLARVCEDLGRPGDAIGHYRRWLEIEPGNEACLIKLGNLYKDKNDLTAAIGCFERALEVNPGNALVHSNLGNVLEEQGLIEEAMTSHHRALDIDPGNPLLHSNLGITLKTLGKLDEAIEAHERAVEIDSGIASIHNNLGYALEVHGRLNDAEKSYLKALAIDPEYAEALYNLGNALTSLGRLKEAEDSYRKTLAVQPEYAEAHRNLVNLIKHSEYDEDIKAMEEAYSVPSISDEQKMHLSFGLGKAFEDIHLYDKAFRFFKKGNSLKRRGYNYSINDQGKVFENLKEVFDSELFAQHLGSGCEDETPIFILGMPRSGTTLVEQILASHPQVYGAGELETVNQYATSYLSKGNGIEFPESIRQLNGVDFQHLGAEYVKNCRNHSPDIRFITDKMPGNFKYIGLIKLLLPNAKVIHCRRDPADTCLSIFKNYFTGTHEYSYDLVELGHYFNLYRGLMDHWHRVLPGFVHDVQYEDIVADQEEQTRALLKYCDLEWDDACLKFYKTDRAIKTASAEQVRRPIYKDSVQLWKRYETELSPLLEILKN